MCNLLLFAATFAAATMSLTERLVTILTTVILSSSTAG